MPPTPEISVVVPAHRAEKTIRSCVEGLLRQTLPASQFEIHLVDSGEDGAAEIATEIADKHGARLQIHRAERLGPGAKRNRGAAASSAAHLAFTDADCVPDPGWLEAGLAQLRRGAAVVQGPTLTPDGSPPPPYAHAIYLPGQSALFESCNIMYQADAFRRAGGFSVDLFESEGSYMGEDTELGWRVRRAGGSVAWEPAAVVRHAVGPPDFDRHLRYAWQGRFFPRLVGRVPELRRERLTAGIFLSPSSLRFTAALAGAALAPRSRLGVALALPYLAELAGSARGASTLRSAAGAVGRRLTADSVQQASLLWGSARYRSPVL